MNAIHALTGMPHKIITIYDEKEKAVLYKEVELLDLTRFDEVRKIVGDLFETAKRRGTFAGLAAPQIGSNKAVFIFSYDRTLEHLEAVINPVMEGIGELTDRWEACFSAMCEHERRVAHVRRYDTVKVTYIDIHGNLVKKVLEGFGAQVFQHEYDHLKGVVNVDKPGGEVKIFKEKEEFDAFMKAVREEDSKRYLKT